MLGIDVDYLIMKNLGMFSCENLCALVSPRSIMYLFQDLGVMPSIEEITAMQDAEVLQEYISRPGITWSHLLRGWPLANPEMRTVLANHSRFPFIPNEYRKGNTIQGHDVTLQDKYSVRLRDTLGQLNFSLVDEMLFQMSPEQVLQKLLLCRRYVLARYLLHCKPVKNCIWRHTEFGKLNML